MLELNNLNKSYKEGRFYNVHEMESLVNSMVQTVLASKTQTHFIQDQSCNKLLQSFKEYYGLKNKPSWETIQALFRAFPNKQQWEYIFKPVLDDYIATHLKSNDPSNMFDIPEATWTQAINFFQNPKNKNAFKFRENANHHPSYSFIKVEKEIYAMQDGQTTGMGGFGRVKTVQNRLGQNFVVKIEGRHARGKEDTELQVMNILNCILGEAEVNYNKPFRGKLTDKKLYTIMKLRKGVNMFNLPFYGSPLIIGIKAAEFLERLHSDGIIHGDIKPDNVMVKYDDVEKDFIAEVSLIDFGLSKILPPGKNFVKDYDICRNIYMPFEATGSSFYEEDFFTGNPESFREHRLGRRSRDRYAEENGKKNNRVVIDFTKLEKRYDFYLATDVYSLGALCLIDLHLKFEPAFARQLFARDPKERPSIKALLDKLYEMLEQLSLEFQARRYQEPYQVKSMLVQREARLWLLNAEPAPKPEQKFAAAAPAPIRKQAASIPAPTRRPPPRPTMPRRPPPPIPSAQGARQPQLAASRPVMPRRLPPPIPLEQGERQKQRLKRFG